MAVSEDELGDMAALAHGSVVAGRAVTLARWIGTGRPDQDYPICVAHRGDSPVEYWSEDDPEEAEPFCLAEVNRKPAALGGAEE